MNIEITGDAEKFVQHALASGQFKSVDEIIASFAGLHGDKPLASMEDHIDVDELAATQGVGPIQDARDLKADFWPEDESVDDFLKGIKDRRGVDAARGR